MKTMKTIAERLVDTVDLPDGLRWYEVAGQRLFTFYGLSGAPSSQMVAVLVAQFPADGTDFEFNTGVLQERNGGRWVSIGFSPMDTWHDAARKVEHAMKVLTNG